MNRSVLLIAPVLPSDVRQQAQALEESGLLLSLVTSWVSGGRASTHFYKLPLLRGLAVREPLPVSKKRLWRIVSGDVIERVMRGVGASPVVASDRRFALVDAWASHRARTPTRLVVGREDGCLCSFREARQRGVRCLYNLPTAHYATVRAILEQELASFPGICTISGDRADFSESRLKRKEEELQLADVVLCPSTFVRDSLYRAGIGPDRLRVLPFAADPEWLQNDFGPREPVILCVGQLSLRKGVHRLLRAWKGIKGYRTHRLRFVGAMRLSRGFLREFSGLYEHVAWMSRPELKLEYGRAQALAINSFAEGFAMVIPEAMSCGTPVLASYSSGAEGFVTDHVDARLFASDDEHAIASTLDWALSHPAELAGMGTRARRKAARWTWPHYREAFKTLIRDMCAETGRPTSQRIFDDWLGGADATS